MRREFTIDPDGDLFIDPDDSLDHQLLVNSYNRLQLIYALGRSLCSHTELNRLLDDIVRSLSRVIDMERCFLARYDRKGLLTPLITHNITMDDDRAKWPVSSNIINSVLVKGLAVLSEDTVSDSRFKEASSVKRYQIKSVLCAPLGPKDACMGLIYADNLTHPHSFTEMDLKFFTALSHYISLSLRNTAQIAEANEAQRLSDIRSSIIQEELFRDHQIVGTSEVFLSALKQLKQAARADVNILIQGETGTGKELMALAAHRLSRRVEKPFVVVNIASLAETVLESELFGHEKGAFSGAARMKPGRLELANGGTLFLDEVAEIPLHLQPKLLRVLESKEFERVGGTDRIGCDFRLLCATHKELETEVKEGRFRSDLFYRLMGVCIQVPPLCQRKEDISGLVEHFLSKHGSKKCVSDSAMQCLLRYEWPGNVRELSRLIEAVDAMCITNEITADDLPNYMKTVAGTGEDTFMCLSDKVAKTEEEHIKRAIELADGNMERARRMLRMAKATFFERKKRYSL